MKRAICVHGHFYQPPRENPWLETIELQDSAYPYHDWNARVAAESYGPNATSRILNDQKHITSIVNNYERISFDFGPTLLAWLEPNAPDIYAAVLEADASSRRRTGGHGSAMAQAYNHMIMPLATSRDRRTQVLWGLTDFRHRFGREPEGMWLPETAVDLSTLEALAEQGLRFTILAPGQARRIRRRGARDWTDVAGGDIDPTRAYVQKLPSGREIALFFYDGPISRAVAFEGLLADGARFADRLVSGFSERRDWPQLVSIATDGETYGHHHRHGDMALAYALSVIDERDDVELTNYARFLALHPPTHEVEILENTSWSCAHGVERWRGDCGCHTGGQPGWNQKWRAPLREALDFLRDAAAPRFERVGGRYFRDPWAARDEYIDLVLDRSDEAVQAFMERHGRRPLLGNRLTDALRLLELQRHAMLMYTSCGWFFNDLSGIETVQVIQYAGRVIQLTREVLGVDLEEAFLQRLEKAHSNLPERGDGRAIYESAVRPAMVNPPKVAAHYAVLSLFEPLSARERVYCYDVEDQHREHFEAGRARMRLGHVLVRSRITREVSDVTYVAVHLGDHNVYGGVRPYAGEEEDRKLEADAGRAFGMVDLPGLIRLIDHAFPGGTFSLSSLFRDEQRRIVEILLRASIEETEATYRRVYESTSPLMRFIAELRIPQPRPFGVTAELVLNSRLEALLAQHDVEPHEVTAVLQEARAGDVRLDGQRLGFALSRSLERLTGELYGEPASLPLLRRLQALADLTAMLPFEVRLWETQNAFYKLRQDALPRMLDSAATDAAAREWVERFRALGARLGVRVDEVTTGGGSAG
jgi:alpha-amylase/alpha-mannosidase (GH57 family)